jgi:hypothetical protein
VPTVKTMIGVLIKNLEGHATEPDKQPSQDEMGMQNDDEPPEDDKDALSIEAQTKTVKRLINNLNK